MSSERVLSDPEADGDAAGTPVAEYAAGTPGEGGAVATLRADRRTTGTPVGERSAAGAAEQMPWQTAFLLGLGSLAVGATAPLYDSYVTPFLEERVARSALSGAIMGLDNAMALLLTPLFGLWSDRVRTRIGRRVPFVLVGLPFAAIAFALIPVGYRSGSLLALLVALLAFNFANCAMRAPFQALLSDLVPSRHRSRAYGLMSVMMCVGALAILGASGLLHPIDNRLPFLLGGGVLLAVFAVFVVRLREPDEAHPRGTAANPEESALRAARGFLRGASPMRLQFFAAVVFFHVGFQSFSTWFTTYSENQLGAPRNEAVIGFMVLALANLLASMPAGFAGSRFGRRPVVLAGLAGMVVTSAGLSSSTTLAAALPWIAALGVSWSFALVNLFPMALELGGKERAGTYAGMFFFCQSLAGMLGPAACGLVFDAVDSKRPLFPLMALSLATALVLMLRLRRGFAEAPVERTSLSNL